MFETTPRIIPTLLMRQGGLYKTHKFKGGIYVGDPVNAIRIFNQKEVDELILLDIGNARSVGPIDLGHLSEIASECFMPLSYGGGIRDVETGGKLLTIGIERLIVNTGAYDKSEFLPSLAREYGSSSVIGSIDVGYRKGLATAFVSGGTRPIAMDPIDWCCRVEDMGVGEIMLNVIDRDGALCGYDTKLIEDVTKRISVPLIASGGASSIDDFRSAKAAGANAVAAGAMFVLKGKHRAVLIQYTKADDVFGVS
jgi:cyclase